MKRKQNGWLAACVFAALLPVATAWFLRPLLLQEPPRQASAPRSAPHSAPHDAQAVYEATLRSIFEANCCAPVVFVSINGRDASPSLLKRLARNPQKALPASRGVSNGNGDPWKRAFVDPATKKKGPLLGLHLVQWRGLDGASVQVDMPGSGTTYVLLHQAGRWKVTGHEMAWIN